MRQVDGLPSSQTLPFLKGKKTLPFQISNTHSLSEGKRHIFKQVLKLFPFRTLWFSNSSLREGKRGTLVDLRAAAREDAGVRSLTARARMCRATAHRQLQPWSRSPGSTPHFQSFGARVGRTHGTQLAPGCATCADCAGRAGFAGNV